MNVEPLNLRNYNRPYKRYFLHQYPLENRFSIIIGPRGKGKTTAIIQHLLSKYDGDFFTRKARCVPVDHFMVAGNNLYLAIDDIETGIGKKIPLWLFGFL